MRTTLRDLLRNCRLALKKFLNKRDKWVKDWAGQVSWGHTSGGRWSQQSSTWKDRLQGFLLLRPGLALALYVMELGLPTQGACAVLQGRLGIVTLGSGWNSRRGCVGAKGRAWESSSVPTSDGDRS